MNKITLIIALVTIMNMIFPTAKIEETQYAKTIEPTTMDFIAEISKEADIAKPIIEEMDIIEDSEDIEDSEEEFTVEETKTIEIIEYYEEEYNDEYVTEETEYYEEDYEDECTTLPEYSDEVFIGIAIYHDGMLFEFDGKEYVLDDCDDSPFVYYDEDGEECSIYQDGQSIEITYMYIYDELLLLSVDGIEHLHAPLEEIIAEALAVDCNDIDPNE